MRQRRRCTLCKLYAIYTYGAGEAEDPVPVPLCLTHSILLQMALRLEWND